MPHIAISRPRTVGVAIALTLALACPAIAQAADGDLDPSFGTGGLVSTTKGNEAFATAIDGQGRIVVAGTATISSATFGDFAVARFLPGGELDPSFSGDGVAYFNFPDDGTHIRIDVARAVTIDPQGRIVVAGDSVRYNGTDNDYALIRLNPNGSLDTGFGPAGSNGLVRTNLFGDSDTASSVAVDSQGRIVVGGKSRVGGDFDFSVARYTSSGNLDASFSDDGKTNVDFTPFGGDDDQARAMAIDGQGRIVLAGFSGTPQYDFAVARLKPDGSRDATFGTNSDSRFQGQVTTPFVTGTDFANAVAIDSKGRIVVAGDVVTQDGHEFALARYESDGKLDTAFDDDGKLTTALDDGDDRAQAVGVDSQGRIVAAGQAVGGTTRATALARYRPSGALDGSFGGDGKVVSADRLLTWAMAFDAQDRIVVAGETASTIQFGLARFIGDSVPPAAPAIESGPGNGSYTNDPTPTFEFSAEPGASFACGFDGNSAPSCHSPFTPNGALGDGEHTFSVRAIDRAGNASGATTRSVNIDTHKPDLEITGARRVTTNGRRARAHLQLEADEPVKLTCKVDDRSPEPCEAEYRTPRLHVGRHRVKVTATDRAGNQATEVKRVRVVRDA